ncbi:hypothetical protein J7J84_08225 [bacterium]|nr:hypothetical protein [bacterium]
MGFTETARQHLQQLDKRVCYTLLARNSHPEGSDWVELKLASAGFVLVSDRTEFAASLEFTIPASDSACFAELDPGNVLALFSEVKLVCEVAGESEILFRGFVTEIREEGAHIRVFARDHALKLSRTICAVEIEGDRTDEIENAPLIALAGEFDDHTYGFDPNVTPLGFSSEGKRRAWKPGDIRIYENGEEASPDFYRVYPMSGVVKFLDPLPASPTVSGVRCYIEATSDAAKAVAEALQHPEDDGGIGAASGELDLPDIGIGLHLLEWKRGDGHTSDCVSRIADRLPRNYFFHYDSEAGKYTHGLLEQKETPARPLINVSSFARIRTRERIYTRVVVHGARTNPPNLALNATVADLQAGVGEKYEWNGNEKHFGEGSVALTCDGDSNRGFGRHDAPYSYEFYDFAKYDLGLDGNGQPPRVSAVGIVAANSKNVNSQKSANSKFSYGYEILGSTDDISYERVSPDAHLLLPPLAEALLTNLTMRRMRYVKVRVKPAKDGVSNESDPGLALNEIRIFGEGDFVVEAAVQATDPGEPYYYPELLEKTDGAGPQVLTVEVGDELPESEALKLARDLLEESLYAYFGYEAVCIADPTVRVGDTVSCTHPVTGNAQAFLVERVELAPARTRVFGTDYNAEVLR